MTDAAWVPLVGDRVKYRDSAEVDMVKGDCAWIPEYGAWIPFGYLRPADDPSVDEMWNLVTDGRVVTVSESVRGPVLKIHHGITQAPDWYFGDTLSEVIRAAFEACKGDK